MTAINRTSMKDSTASRIKTEIFKSSLMTIFPKLQRKVSVLSAIFQSISYFMKMPVEGTKSIIMTKYKLTKRSNKKIQTFKNLLLKNSLKISDLPLSIWSFLIRRSTIKNNFVTFFENLGFRNTLKKSTIS